MTMRLMAITKTKLKIQKAPENKLNKPSNNSKNLNKANNQSNNKGH